MEIHDCDQGTEEWRLLRAGRPTASEFKHIITSKGEPSKSMEGYASRLAAELYAQKPLEQFSGNIWTDRGSELEPEARSTYEFVTGRQIQQIGFITNEKAGYSPDGMVGEDGLTEFKCLKTENHVKLMVFYRKNGRCPSDYVAQTQGGIWIAAREWCDLVFYHPELPEVIIRQERDDAFIRKLEEQIEKTIQRRDDILNILRGQ